MDNSKKILQNQIPLKCEICDKVFKTINGLKTHFIIIHDLEQEFQCNIWQKIFYIQKQLISHVKIVLGNKNHNCDLCGKAFSELGNLMKHINVVHNGQKDQKCDFCGKAFS